jgi:hypothetical protein
VRPTNGTAIHRAGGITRYGFCIEVDGPSHLYPGKVAASAIMPDISGWKAYRIRLALANDFAERQIGSSAALRRQLTSCAWIKIAAFVFHSLDRYYRHSILPSTRRIKSKILSRRHSIYVS